MEYDIVELAEDVINEKAIGKLTDNKDKVEPFEIEQMKEEVNILYVALTRSRNKLFVPEKLLQNASRILKESRFIKKGKKSKAKGQDAKAKSLG